MKNWPGKGRCQPMPSREDFERQNADLEQFVDRLRKDPRLTFGCGLNLPEHFTTDKKIAMLAHKFEYLRTGLSLLEQGGTAPQEMPFTFGALRIGDVGAILSPGENFAETGIRLRALSPFVHTLVCGDINGLFGNIFTDYEIDHGGCAVDAYYEILALDGFRLPPAKGTVQQFLREALALLGLLHSPDAVHEGR